MTYPYPARPPRQGTAVLGLVVFLAIVIPALIAAAWFVPTAFAWHDCGAPAGQAAVLAITRGSPSVVECLAVAVAAQ